MYEYGFLGGATKSSEELEQRLKKILEVVLVMEAAGSIALFAAAFKDLLENRLNSSWS